MSPSLSRQWFLWNRSLWSLNDPKLPSFCRFWSKSDHSFFRKTEAVARRCSVKILLLKILPNSLECTCARVYFLINLQAWGLGSTTLLKKRVWHRCFPVNFAKFLRTPFYVEHLRWLLLENSRKNERFRFMIMWMIGKNLNLHLNQNIWIKSQPFFGRCSYIIPLENQ